MAINITLLLSASLVALSASLLFIYFTRKMKVMENKMDTLFQLIQEYANEADSAEREMIQVTENSRITVSDDEDEDENFYNKMSQNYEQRQTTHDDYDVIDVDDDVELEGGDSNWNAMNASHNENRDENDDEEDEDDDDEDDEDDEDDDKQQTNNELTEVTPHDEVMQNIEEVKLLKESKPQENDNLEGSLEEITLESNVKTVAIENMIDFSQLKVAELKNLCSEKKLSGYSSLNKKELISLLENTK